MPLFPQLTEECKEKEKRERRVNKMQWIMFFAFVIVISSMIPILPLPFENPEGIKQNLAAAPKMFVLLTLFYSLPIILFSKLILSKNDYSGTNKIMLFAFLGMYVGSMIGLSMFWFMG